MSTAARSTSARLASTPQAEQQLLAAISIAPLGQKLSIPKLRDALLCQGDILDALQRLVAAGRLDRATLRPPARQNPMVGSDAGKTSPTADEGAVALSPAQAAPSTIAIPSGAELAAKLDALIAEHDLSKTAVSMHLFNGTTGGIEALRRAAKARPKTAERVFALLADPPVEELRRYKRGTSSAHGAGQPAPEVGLANARTLQRQTRPPDTAPVNIDPPTKVDPHTDVLRPTFLKPAEIAWCSQCDQRVSGAKASKCTSRWCSLKEGKAA